MAWTWAPAGNQNFWAEDDVTHLRLFVERVGNQYRFNGYTYLNQQVAQGEVELYGNGAITRHKLTADNPATP